MTVVIIDTNIWLLPYTNHVDLVEQINRLVPDAKIVLLSESKIELAELASKSDKQGRAAKLGLSIIDAADISVVENRKVFKRADEAIIEFATSESVVATNDKELRQKLKIKGVRCIIPRQNNYLIFEE